MKTKFKQSAVLAAISILLAACSGDDSTVSESPDGYNVSVGLAQKGPLLRGSGVTINELTSNTLQPNSRSYTFEVKDDSGTFMPTSVSFASSYHNAVDLMPGTTMPGIVAQIGQTGIGVSYFLNQVEVDLADDGLSKNSSNFMTSVREQVEGAAQNTDLAVMTANLNAFYKTNWLCFINNLQDGYL